MAETKRLQFIIDAENRTKEAFDDINKQLDGMEKRLKPAAEASQKVALALAGAAAAAVGFLGVAVKAAAESEESWAKIGKNIENSGYDVDKVKIKFQEFATATQKLTGYSDEYIATIASKFLPVIQDTTASMELTSLALDLESAGVANAESAVKALTLAHEGDITMLKRYVPSLRLADEEQIKNMSSSERATYALDALKAQFGGMAEAAGSTFSGKLRVLNETWGDFLEIVGAKILPILSVFIEKVTAFVQDKLPLWIDKTKEIVKWLGEHKAVIIIVAGAIIGALLPAILSMVVAFASAAIALAPWVIGGALIAGIVAGILWIIKHWEDIKEKVVEIFTAIADFFVSIWEKIKMDWELAWTSIVIVVTTIWDKIKNAVSTSLLWVKNKFTEITTPIAEAWHSLWEGLGNAVSIAWEAVKDTIKAGINWIIGAINTVINTINKVVKAGASIFGLKAPQISTIPLLAEGGIVQRPTLAIVGEAGPEAVVPLNRMSMAGAGIGGSITINITGNEFLGEEGIAERIGNQIMRTLKDTIKL